MDRENLELNGRTFRASGSDDGKGTYDTGEGVCVSRVHNNKSIQLPYGFYTHHLDGMT